MVSHTHTHTDTHSQPYSITIRPPRRGEWFCSSVEHSETSVALGLAGPARILQISLFFLSADSLGEPESGPKCFGFWLDWGKTFLRWRKSSTGFGSVQSHTQPEQSGATARSLACSSSPMNEQRTVARVDNSSGISELTSRVSCSGK